MKIKSKNVLMVIGLSLLIACNPSKEVMGNIENEEENINTKYYFGHHVDYNGTERYIWIVDHGDKDFIKERLDQWTKTGSNHAYLTYYGELHISELNYNINFSLLESIVVGGQTLIFMEETIEDCFLRYHGTHGDDTFNWNSFNEGLCPEEMLSQEQVDEINNN